MLLADVGITDYSSWICDYILTKKPGFIFATDLADYNQERGFYYPLNTLPYPIAENNEQLIQNILNFQTDGFNDKCDKFLKSKGCIDDGHAAERIVDKLEQIIKEG
jgi:CDP-glycerol glycerophosphotransferase